MQVDTLLAYNIGDANKAQCSMRGFASKVKLLMLPCDLAPRPPPPALCDRTPPLTGQKPPACLVTAVSYRGRIAQASALHCSLPVSLHGE